MHPAWFLAMSFSVLNLQKFCACIIYINQGPKQVFLYALMHVRGTQSCLYSWEGSAQKLLVICKDANLEF